MFNKLISGITEIQRKKWNGIHHAKEYMTTTVEWEVNAKADLFLARDAQYELLAYTKSSDEQFVDYIHIKYKLKCHLTPSFGISQVDRHMNRNLIKGFRNLLLHKALSAFKKEGIIDFISYSDTNDGPEKDTFQIKNNEN